MGEIDNKLFMSIKSQELTSKELQILKLIANGLSNKEISLKLGLNLPNTKSRLTTIFRKLGVSSRTEAICICLKVGILTYNDILTYSHSVPV
jgi:DNA-binding NarL/FixJ family response regulator